VEADLKVFMILSCGDQAPILVEEIEMVHFFRTSDEKLCAPLLMFVASFDP
jgi:hypothetical protein